MNIETLIGKHSYRLYIGQDIDEKKEYADVLGRGFLSKAVP